MFACLHSFLHGLGLRACIQLTLASSSIFETLLLKCISQNVHQRIRSTDNKEHFHVTLGLFFGNKSTTDFNLIRSESLDELDVLLCLHRWFGAQNEEVFFGGVQVRV